MSAGVVATKREETMFKVVARFCARSCGPIGQRNLDDLVILVVPWYKKICESTSECEVYVGSK